ncbi:phage terminase small subunit [Pseudochelatococcus lubricantis]|uniref:Phage terminase small subunit n=1 Tax=Pseudochelatococcus lubricantis TaxID=1538102 RepID=A0ABX0UZ40_9HYPH|nr:terminase small subunit [Pseudochelatococcus lubricantis]NIJ57215.1 phage terminase small subunit [Pseudochelatococcus lubricantis]
MALTPRQGRFVDEYMKSLNATQAAIRAGYSAKTADVQGPQLLRKTSVANELAKRQGRLAAKTEITKDRIVAELAKLAFYDVRKAVKWGPGEYEKALDDGTVARSSGVLLIDSDDLDAETAAAISEVGNTRDGVKIKFHDKRGALVDLAKMLGMYDGGKDDDDDPPPLHIKIDVRDAVSDVRVTKPEPE